MKNKIDIAFTTDTKRWNALVNRNQLSDNAFFYGVKTTGIYCRPVCTSRLPKREHVVFFTNSFDAETAGFRPCKRCMPHDASAGELQAQMITHACRLINDAEDFPQLRDLAAAAGMSISHFHRIFKKMVGITPKEYSAAVRIQRVKGGLTRGVSVTDAMYDAGFHSSSRFYESSTETLGMTPKLYRSGAEGLKIRVAVVQTYLGWTLVAATNRGICSIEFGDTPQMMVDRLENRFPKAKLVTDDISFTSWVSKVTAFIDAPEKGLDIPLDVQGTAFQQRVWKALMKIPPGSTKTYSEIAAQIGKPKAARAVGNACASNKIAVAIPCHRVVRVNGDLGGYAWGIERKQTLLEHEREGPEDI